MGLIPNTPGTSRQQRLRYAWGWRLRYWWMDTEDGKKAHLWVFSIALLVTLGQVARLSALAVMEITAPPGEPVMAIADWIVYLIILVISAAVSYALRPKPENAKPQDYESPTTTDGTPVIDYFGTCWVDHEDQFLLAWKITGRDPIKSKGGK